MDEQTAQRSRRSGPGARIFWLLVIVAIVVLWWWFRSQPPAHEAHLAPSPDEVADALSAPTDPDDILIDLVDDATPDAVAAIERDLGITLALVDQSGVAARTRFYRAHVEPARRDAILAALAARPGVELAEPDAEFAISPGELERITETTATHPGFPDDPDYRYQWHLNQIGMPEAWKLADGNGVVVAVLDTGVAYENYKKFSALPDLAGVEMVKPFDFVGNTVHANDDHAHGSHVAGTIAQATNNGIGVAGVGLKVRIMPLKVLSGSGSGSVGGIADAIRYAADNGAKVINMSLGGAFPSRALKNAVAYAHDKGVTVICAAGNESRGKVAYPAAYPGAVAIAATQYDESTTFYSNWGKEIDLAAPGGNTRIDQNGDGKPDGVLQNTIAVGDPGTHGYYAFMGTSMAAPHAAGVAALVVGEGVKNPDAVEKILKQTARRPTNQKYDAEHYGAGIIDAPAAIKAARKYVAETEDQGGGARGLALGLLAAGAFAVWRRGRGLGIGYVAGTVLGAAGLFFVPALGGVPVMGVLAEGVPAWGNGSWLMASALVPLAALLVGYGAPKLRGAIAGLAVGVGANLALLAFAPAGLHAPLWLALNALVCVGIARVALR